MAGRAINFLTRKARQIVEFLGCHRTVARLASIYDLFARAVEFCSGYAASDMIVDSVLIT